MATFDPLPSLFLFDAAITNQKPLTEPQGPVSGTKRQAKSA